MRVYGANRSDGTAMPYYATFAAWKQMTGMSRSSANRALARGDLRAKKVGARTLIDVQAGLDWLESLPDAKIRLPAR